METCHVDLAGHLIAEATAAGVVTREYVWLDDMPLAVAADLDTATPNLWYVHADHLDRPIRMTDGTKTEVWNAFFMPFGAVDVILGPASNNLRFPGQYFLIESGLHYNWHRHYDPTIGRYTQPDPLGLLDGPSLFVYAENNPLNLIDPLGLEPEGHHWVTGPIRNNPDLSPDARQVFRDAKTGYYGERHGWDKAHSEYNKGVQDLWNSKKFDPANMSKAQALAFVREVMRSADPRVADYRRQIINQCLNYGMRRGAWTRGGQE